jgi:uncharacterized protein (DUF1697 family)
MPLLVRARASDTSQQLITTMLENAFRRQLGKPITVFIRTVSHLRKMITQNPFHTHTSQSTKRYVTFIDSPISTSITRPLWSPKQDVEIIHIAPSEIFSLSYKRKGRFGHPTTFVESRFSVTATTRNWNTIQGIVQMAQQ